MNIFRYKGFLKFAGTTDLTSPMMAKIIGTTIGAIGAAVQIAETTEATGETTGETKTISKSGNSETITGNEEIGPKATFRLGNVLKDPTWRTATRNRIKAFALKIAAAMLDALRLIKAEASSLKSNIKNFRTLSRWNQNF